MGFNQLQSTRPFSLWLISGLVGFGLALVSLVNFKISAPALISSKVAAEINGEEISQDRYQQVLSVMEAEKSEITKADRELILDRMIDEELLFQHARDLQLDRNDPGIRKSMITAVIEGALETAPESKISDKELRSYYESHRGLFQKPPLMRVRARGTNQLLPQSWTSAADLATYVGSHVAKQVEAATKGARIALPTKGELEILERSEAWIPNFETVKSEVEYEVRKARQDDALKSFVSQLRSKAKIRKGPL